MEDSRCLDFQYVTREARITSIIETLGAFAAGEIDDSDVECRLSNLGVMPLEGDIPLRVVGVGRVAGTQMNLQRLKMFHKTRLGFAVFGLVELVAAYVAASLALDRGNLLYYLVALILFVGVLQNLVKLIGEIAHGDKTSTS